MVGRNGASSNEVPGKYGGIRPARLPNASPKLSNCLLRPDRRHSTVTSSEWEDRRLVLLGLITAAEHYRTLLNHHDAPLSYMMIAAVGLDIQANAGIFRDAHVLIEDGAPDV